MEAKKENIIAAWKAGCEDVKEVLENLYPTVEFRRKLKYKEGDVFFMRCKIKELSETEDNYPYRVEPFDFDEEYECDIWLKERDLLTSNTLLK